MGRWLREAGAQAAVSSQSLEQAEQVGGGHGAELSSLPGAGVTAGLPAGAFSGQSRLSLLNIYYATGMCFSGPSV